MWKSAYVTLPVRDYEAAKKFYSESLGLELDREMPEGGGAVYKAGDSMLLVYASEFAGTNKATAASFLVDDVQEAVNKLKEKGVSFEQYDNLPGVTREGDIHKWGDEMEAAWFKDPDGNILALGNMEG